MSKTARTAAKPNIYQIVTDRIIHSLKAGVIPWEKPWKTPHFHGGPFPRNFRTGKPYRGVNILLLWSSPYSSPFWLTFKQALDLKGTVRKGEKGTPIVFYSQLQNRKDDQRATEKGRKACLRVLLLQHVNAEQCDGLTLPQIDQPTTSTEIESDKTCGHRNQMGQPPRPPSDRRTRIPRLLPPKQ